MSKSYVWHSTQESRDNGTTSVLAIVETLFFVTLTWGIAYYYDFYTHIYTAIAIAPFLLLRTPESTNKAIEWFLYEHSFDDIKYYKDPYFYFVLIISSLVSFAIAYFFSTQVLIHYEGWELFFLSMLLGITGLGAVGVGIGLIGRGGIDVVIIGVLGVLYVVTIGVAGVEGAAGAGIGGVTMLLIIIVVKKRIQNLTNKTLKNFLLFLLSPIFIIFIMSIGFMVFAKSLVVKVLITVFTV